MRITQNVMMRRYTRNLGTALCQLNEASQRVNTLKKFSKASENPGDAARAYQVRKEYAKTEIHLDHISNIRGTLDCQEASLMQVSGMVETAYTQALEAVNGTMDASDRKIAATKLRDAQQGIVMALNSQFGGSYVFGGSCTKEPPFSAGTDGGLAYRGIALASADPEDQKRLAELAKESVVVDVGIGLSFAPGETTPNAQSGFNVSLPGVAFLGHGRNDDGSSADLYALLGRLAEQLEQPEAPGEEAGRMIQQLGEQKKQLLVCVTEVGCRSNFADFVSSRLENSQHNLNTKILNLEYVTHEKAIMEYEMFRYSYQAALSVGNKLLQSSFIDFMG